VNFDIYQLFLRPLLFSGLKVDPETLHHLTLQLLHRADQQPHLAAALGQLFAVPPTDSLSQTLWGLTFPTPLGLAAGFDKDGVAAGIWPQMGFGFAEMGTVTSLSQPGNPQPRLFRLPQDQAALNRMGFNNQGAVALAERLRRRWGDAPRAHPPLGINLGKSKLTPLEEAPQDYLTSFRQLKELGDYFVVNVSSPNTPGLRSLQSSDQLGPILDALQTENDQQRPLLVKIAPDLEDEAIAEVIDLAQRYRLAGIIATNTTIRRDQLRTQTLERTGNPLSEEAGGISGAPVRSRSTEVIRLIYQHSQGQLPIIGVGGIFSTEDAWEKITAGASLLQVYTGWIYQGPWMAKRIAQGLGQKLTAAGLTHIQDAVGSALHR
jgi:dihydroorotate dehydrogenase